MSRDALERKLQEALDRGEISDREARQRLTEQQKVSRDFNGHIIVRSAGRRLNDPRKV